MLERNDLTLSQHQVHKLSWSDGYGSLGKWEGGAYCLYIESDLEERSAQSLTRHRWSIDSQHFSPLNILVLCVGIVF